MKPSAARAFTLTELLVVVAIMGLLAALSIPAMQSMAGAGKFNQAVSGVAGLLELARAQAIAQNTYTWVVFWQNNPQSNTPSDTHSPLEIYVGAYLSNDGTDPFAWSGSVTLPAGTVAATTLIPISRVLNFKQTGLIVSGGTTFTLPNAPTTPGAITYPVNSPNFKYPSFKTGTSTASLASANTGSGLVEFTPSGAARTSGSPVESIWLGLYPIKGKSVAVASNVASLKINGLTGLVTVYRK